MDISRLLSDVFNELEKEMRSNPDLRMRLEKITQKYLTGTERQPVRPHRRQPGAFDPMAVYRESPDQLKPRLEGLSIEQLKDMVADQGMDRSKLAMKWKTKDRLVDLIITTVENRSHKGDAFRTLPFDIDRAPENE